jgi:DNA-directed RNA polymerase subunit RPC12/RpoP
MPLEIKQFKCPQCSSPLELKNAGKSRSIVCPACHSQIDLTGLEYKVVGNVGSRRTPKMTPFEIGMHATVEGEAHAIIGRVRYSDDEDAWDEWLLLSASGDYRWISEDEDEGMVV